MQQRQDLLNYQDFLSEGGGSLILNGFVAMMSQSSSEPLQQQPNLELFSVSNKDR